MTSHHSHPSSAGVAPSWVVVVSEGGVQKGMVGPFPDADAAEAWARQMVGSGRHRSWRCEPVVSPAALPAAPEAPPRRRHLELVR